MSDRRRKLKNPEEIRAARAAAGRKGGLVKTSKGFGTNREFAKAMSLKAVKAREVIRKQLSES